METKWELVPKRVQQPPGQWPPESPSAGGPSGLPDPETRMHRHTPSRETDDDTRNHRRQTPDPTRGERWGLVSRRETWRQCGARNREGEPVCVQNVRMIKGSKDEGLEKKVFPAAPEPIPFSTVRSYFVKWWRNKDNFPILMLQDPSGVSCHWGQRSIRII